MEGYGMSLKKVISIVLAASLIGITGCKDRHEEDIKEIEKIPEQFIEALAEDDQDAVEDVSLIRNYYYSTMMYRNTFRFDFLKHAISLASIDEIGEITFNDEYDTARAEVTISYPDLAEFSLENGDDYLTLDQMYELLDSGIYETEKTMDLKFQYKEKDGKWYLSPGSSKRIYELFTSYLWFIDDPVVAAPSEGEEMFEDMFDSIAHGDLYDIPMGLNLEECRVYDDVSIRGEGDKTREAVENFVSAYVNYILEHDHEFTNTYSYNYRLEGSAPSSEDLYEALTTDEFLVDYYMNFIRYSSLNWDLDDMWDDQSALIYDTLTEAIPHCSPEDYVFSASAYSLRYGNTDDTFPFIADTDLIIEPEFGMFVAEHSVTEDQYLRCMEEAIERLLQEGEIDDQMYEAMIEDLYSDNDTQSTGSDGTLPNQAVNVVEHVPSWCDDGSIVYGYSDPDENGIWMSYSKQPGWLNTVEYYVDEDGIWITCIFDHRFNAGTTLLVDWWIDDEQVVDSERIYIAEDNTTVVTVSLPTDGFPDNDMYEMRLWEDGHHHVICYTTLYNTVY